MKNPIFHITSALEYEQALVRGEYRPGRFEREGFIHCSYAEQVLGVANQRYRGRTGLVLLEIDRASVGADVVDENLDGGESLFPHIYGPLPTTAVRAVHDFPPKGDGTFDLPASARAHHG